MNWQLIETAPLDVNILLFSKSFGVWPGIVCRVTEPGVSPGFPLGSLQGRIDKFNSWGDCRCKPTHWMPFPEPPNPASASLAADEVEFPKVQLLPCPFCGMDPELGPLFVPEPNGNDFTTITCVNPNCAIQPSVERIGYDSRSIGWHANHREAAAAAWNERP